MKRSVLGQVFLAAFLAGSAVAQAPVPPEKSAPGFVSAQPAKMLAEPGGSLVRSIEATALGAHIAFLASPSLEGRGLGSNGLEAAAEYVAAFLTRAGVTPIPASGSEKGSPSYFQVVPFREISEPAGELEVERRSGEEVRGRSFGSGADCLIPPLPPRVLTAPIIFAEYGIREKVPARDDYQGLDVKGKVVVLRSGVPPGEAWRAPALVSKYASEEMAERFRAKVEAARRLGAVAVLAIEGDGWVTRILAKEKPAERGFFRVDDGEGSDGDPVLVRISPAVAAFLFGLSPAAGVEPTFSRAALASVRVTIRTKGKERLKTSRNVLGFLEGSDPVLKTEAVVVGAHMDHLGKVGGVVHPGADDNASGVAGLLEIARALALAPRKPKRSVAFAFWTGEEGGQIGSGHYVRNPLWPLSRTTAYVNLDMIGHPWTMKEIEKLVSDSPFEGSAQFLSLVKAADFAEPGVADWAPELAPVLEQAGKATGLDLHFDWTDGQFGGSDYREFARLRIPFIRFFGNFFPGYHEPIDTPEKLDFVQTQKLARLAGATVWLLADR